MVDFLDNEASSKARVRDYCKEWVSYILEASVAMRSKISLTKELRMAMALLEIPVSGCTCLSTAKM